MSTKTFSVTWDYRCPFARNAHEHVIAGLRAGADWDVTFLPFSLGQSHVAEGEPDVWDRPESDSGLLALQAGVAVRDHQAELFLDAHEALFLGRFERSQNLRDEAVVAKVLADVGVDAEAVLDEIHSGRALATIKAEHTGYVASHNVWGVPTFITGPYAAFVRLMHRPDGDPASSITTIERTVDLLGGWPDLNEFKHTSIPR